MIRTWTSPQEQHAHQARAVGTAAVERVLDAEGELASFAASRTSPRSAAASCMRSCAASSAPAPGKVGYGTLLVDALELDRVPPALDLALARVHG